MIALNSLSLEGRIARYLVWAEGWSTCCLRKGRCMARVSGVGKSWVERVVEGIGIEWVVRVS